MTIVYIACPANLFTGGPTLLHQLCFELRERGGGRADALH